MAVNATTVLREPGAVVQPQSQHHPLARAGRHLRERIHQAHHRREPDQRHPGVASVQALDQTAEQDDLGARKDGLAEDESRVEQ
ncbi:hypothetical protein [Kribbella sp. NBC_00889]|uniref:hypothetical protein n=1 Tax=Kribbella sp. NBC_00889 TaxID=2975974 RepID=UPI0038703441|nr:hypothetical protein OG817_19430 [Kribbella sp. NBC_00889]